MLIGAYLLFGLAGCLIFGGLMVWTDNRNMQKLSKLFGWITVLCLPALALAGAVDVIGSIGG